MVQPSVWPFIQETLLEVVGTMEGMMEDTMEELIVEQEETAVGVVEIVEDVISFFWAR